LVVSDDTSDGEIQVMSQPPQSLSLEEKKRKAEQ
jgi:hypothetical protein